MYQKPKCQMCGKEFEFGSRWGKQYCNANCRKRASRRKQYIKKMGGLAIDHIKELEGFLIHKQLKTLACDELIKVFQVVEAALEAAAE